jgi:replicative superfamily II helicase
MPTSAGKTRIAEMAIAKTLIEQPGSKCIYVAPYRALVWEIEDVLDRVFTDLGYKVSSVIGSYESDEFEDFLFRNTDVLIITPEKLDLVQRIQSEFLNSVRLLVLDEGHIVDDRRRGAKFELLLTRLRRKLKEARFIFISAVMPQQTLEDFANWIGAGRSQVITSDWRPSIQRKAKFKWQGRTGVIRYSREEDISGLNEFVPGVIQKVEYEYTNPTTLRVNRTIFPGSTKADAAAELAIRFSELGAVLVFCTQPNFTIAVAKAMQRALSLHRTIGESIPSCFQHTPITRSIIAANEWLGSEHPVTQALKSGIAVHYGDLPEVVRKAIEVDFRANRYQVIIATNTLAQGVNLPIRTVVIHSCRRFDPVSQSLDRIPTRDYWNIAGRAGRAGIETVGTIVHIVFNNRDEGDFNYYMDKANIEPVRGALFQMLNDLLTERISEEALGAELDSEILAMLVEESISSPDRQRFEEILGQSLVYIQAVKDNLNFTPLVDTIVRVANNTLLTVTDEELRKVYAGTGLSTNSCEFIRQSIATQVDMVSTLLREAGINELSRLADFFLQCCTNLPEIQPDREFGGDCLELLVSWISGDSPEVLSEKFGDQAGSSEELAKFVEEFFGYLLPWGISACIKIASSILKLEPNVVSEFIRYFPSMTKYGLADPKACWLMSIGIPSRRIALDMAAAFQAESSRKDYDSFLEWLGGLDEERLQDGFKLTGLVLEDVARAVFRSKSNPLLVKYPDARAILPIEVEVRGISYENRSVVARQVRQGDKVDLVRDYDNPVDANAIKVIHSRGELGFVPRDTSQLLALEVDTGLRLVASVTAITPGRVPKIKIIITEASD